MKKVFPCVLLLICFSSKTIIAQNTDKRFAGLDTAFSRILKDTEVQRIKVLLLYFSIDPIAIGFDES